MLFFVHMDWSRGRQLSIAMAMRVGVASLAAACASTPPSPGPLNRAALRASQPRSIVATNPPPAPFEGETSLGNALPLVLGPVGWALRADQANAEGDEMKHKQVYDPAAVMRRELVQGLSKRFSLQIVEAEEIKPRVVPVSVPPPVPRDPEANGEQQVSPPPRPTTDQPMTIAEVARLHGGVDLVLEIRTDQWGFAPVRLGHYGVTYRGTLRLIDTRTRTLVAEGNCVSLPVDSPDAPSYDELLANNAMLLKADLTSLEQFCTDDYRTRILGLYGQ